MRQDVLGARGCKLAQEVENGFAIAGFVQVCRRKVKIRKQLTSSDHLNRY